MKKTNKLAALGLSAGLLAGAGSGMILSMSGAAGAQTGSATTQAAARPAPGEKLKEVLASLVTDGTLTQEQSDKVYAAMEAARPAEGEGPPGGGQPGQGGGQGERERPGLQAAATALGVTEDELKAAFKEGKSIADVATAQGKDLDDVKQAMLDEAKAKQAERVAAGEITQEQADTRYAELESRIDDIVTRTPPARGERPTTKPETSASTSNANPSARGQRPQGKNP
jgi:polyhydroxyalkanoate synthesis regulator phasin